MAGVVITIVVTSYNCDGTVTLNASSPCDFGIVGEWYLDGVATGEITTTFISPDFGDYQFKGTCGGVAAQDSNIISITHLNNGVAPTLADCCVSDAAFALTAGTCTECTAPEVAAAYFTCTTFPTAITLPNIFDPSITGVGVIDLEWNIAGCAYATTIEVLSCGGVGNSITPTQNGDGTADLTSNVTGCAGVIVYSWFLWNGSTWDDLSLTTQTITVDVTGIYKSVITCDGGADITATYNLSSIPNPVAGTLVDCCETDNPFAQPTTFCTLCSPAEIAASYWTGVGMINNIFYPAIAGLGTHVLTWHIAGQTITAAQIVNSCPEQQEWVKFLVNNCCYADKVYEAVKALNQGKKGLSKKYYSQARWMRMALDILKCYQDTSTESLPTWTLTVSAIDIGGVDVTLDYGGTVIGASATVSQDVDAWGIEMADNINSNVVTNGGFTATWDYTGGIGTLVVIAPYCYSQGTFNVSVNPGGWTAEWSDSLTGGACASTNCITQTMIDSINEKFIDLCGCACCKTDIANDTVVLSGGRRFPKWLY